MQTIELIAGTPSLPANKRIVALFVLILTADILLFGQGLGLNLVLFTVAISVGILLTARKHFGRAKMLWLMGFALTAALPLLVAPSWMGVITAIWAVMCIALAACGLMPRRLARLPLVLVRFLVAAPLRLLEDWGSHFAFRPKYLPTGNLWPGLLVWAMPVTLAAVFLVLFAMANPLIDTVLRNIDLRLIWNVTNFWRIGFWLMVAICVWALLRPRLIRLHARPQLIGPVKPAPESMLLGHASVLRSLLVFNAMFAVQTLLDLVYLWGGAELPDGMGHAEYAHRGAYPLIATALLAGAFVLVTMRPNGAGDRSPVIRGLVHAWIGQNILLCLSAILRLDLYVEIYSLTELRIAAGIWMGLVAIGLALILLRILLRRSNEWLIATNLASLLAVLYLCAFIDIPGFIARFNVAHSREITGQGAPLDIDYLRSLGPSAIPALDIYLAALPELPNFAAFPSGKAAGAQWMRAKLVSEFRHQPSGWRGWNLRSARLDRYLDTPPPIAR